MLKDIYHLAIIYSDNSSKDFYIRILGLKVIVGNYRAVQDPFKLDLALPDFPHRPSFPEAQNLRYLAFNVESVE